MTTFQAYLYLGFSHITDLQGYDHILFIVALCAIFQLSDWKKILILVTAFTLGHSITLALATLKILTFRSDLIEFLIPVTILITAIGNLFHKEKTSRMNNSGNSQRLRYIAALCFGLIHGLGFSNFLRSLLGKEESIIQPLFAFNVGLEAGQLLIVGILLLIGFVFTAILKVNRFNWNLVISGIVIGIALTLILKTNIFV
ncbi:HupE/UreJ family protein [Rhodocytophaga rosea]|uniref:HupE/UreJ family protein n=1 Tax=Rhodocytophaga rosea TaxID=2704465 RepID=A0A6C0GGC5_9BACT|nr:HupE/UreJ family protein [Rhodocytophaga rosea]QHT67048.1 HupE/UreJ family protein [Rhodocytophaga rosea]